MLLHKHVFVNTLQVRYSPQIETFLYNLLLKAPDFVFAKFEAKLVNMAAILV